MSCRCVTFALLLNNTRHLRRTKWRTWLKSARMLLKHIRAIRLLPFLTKTGRKAMKRMVVS